MNIFNSIPLLRPKRNTFNLGGENRLTTDIGRLTPFMIKEALPDDVFKLRAECFARVFPALNAPIFQRFDVRYYYFFVPTRIIWDEFEDWINPKSGKTDIVAPRIHVRCNDAGPAANSFTAQAILGGPKSLGDYLGVNLGYSPEDQAKLANWLRNEPGEGGSSYPSRDIFGKDGFIISSLPFRAYQQIYNDWFIDLNNAEPAQFSKGSGVEDCVFSDEEYIANPEQYLTNHALYQALLKMRYRAWEHDYFTTAMTDAQRGDDVMAFDGTFDIPETSVNEINLPSQRVQVNEIDVSSVKQGDTRVGSIEALADIYADFGFATREDFILYNGLQTVDGRLEFSRNIGNSEAQAVNKRAAGEIKLRKTTDSGTSQPSSFMIGVTKRTLNESTQQYSYETVYLPVSVRTVETEFVSQDPIFVIPSQRVASAGVTVEELRVRMQMQSFLERNNVAGSRYTELLYAHWGVKDPDGRLQRSEFLGGGRTPVMVNEVTQTSAPTDVDPLGQYAGQGTSSGMTRPIKFRAPEHGFVIGLMAIMPRTGYFQGLHRMWKRFDRLDMYWPSFAHLGEQELKNHEVLFSGFDQDGTFGYQQRYAEYKTGLDEVHGDMKGNLAFWHGARAFATPSSEDDIPKLSKEFTTPQYSGADGIDRIFPVLSQELVWYNDDHFVVDMYSHCIASRRMPKYVTPRNGS